MSQQMCGVRLSAVFRSRRVLSIIRAAGQGGRANDVQVSEGRWREEEELQRRLMH